MKATEKDLAQIFLKAKNEKDVTKLLSIFTTSKEYDEILNRLRILQMLDQGISQREVAKKLGVGIATVTRGSRELENYRSLSK